MCGWTSCIFLLILHECVDPHLPAAHEHNSTRHFKTDHTDISRHSSGSGHCSILRKYENNLNIDTQPRSCPSQHEHNDISATWALILSTTRLTTVAMQSAISLARCLFETHRTTPLIMGLDPLRTRPPDQIQKSILCLPLHHRTRCLPFSQDARNPKKPQQSSSSRMDQLVERKTASKKNSRREKSCRRNFFSGKSADPADLLRCNWLSRSDLCKPLRRPRNDKKSNSFSFS